MTVYTVSFNYSATGEGWREELGVVHATTLDDAVNVFFDLLRLPESVRAYLRPGLEVTVGLDRSVLARWVTEARLERLEQAMKYQGHWRMSYAVNGG
ncbi:hypothetical protein GO986_17370 [Deinococcus sp. HMF7620]|uniref:Uncharacterized protein n=1 Tax=Deinococcus arboris TaxID=2682977 RepID=A0A7C9HTF4_9DEIO|nr:hypothetical protein [Deinococcus arboris]MVN88513.1 hypothetical protein [Deinococcus arboris]